MSYQLTREGNAIFPATATIRAVIRGNSMSICAKCRHLSDQCTGVSKITSGRPRIQCVTSCDGFELVESKEVQP